jgi:hypothetical protein
MAFGRVPLPRRTYSDRVDEFWEGVLEEARRPPTPRAAVRPALRRLQSARRTGELLAAELQGSEEGRDERGFRTVFQLVDDFRSVDPELRSELVREPPELTGDLRFDAFLAATVEHLAFHASLPIPRWAAERDALLPRFWFPSPYETTRARALVESPAAFRRRGIFIEESDLHRV